jgi:cell division protein FtsB
MRTLPKRLSVVTIFLALVCQTRVVFPSSAWATELSIESQRDQSPAALKVLSERARLLEQQFSELEKRLIDDQSKLAARSNADLVELSISLAPKVETIEKDKIDSIIISHLRMSLNGKPHIFNQDALLASHELPIPLYLGLITRASHLLKVQFQASYYTGMEEPSTQRTWFKVDETFRVDLATSESRKVAQSVLIDTDKGTMRISLQDSSK